MSTWDRQLRYQLRGWRWIALALSIVVVMWAIVLGTRARTVPARCGAGFETMAARCCAPGQNLSAGKCVGAPAVCPPPFELIREPVVGCVFPSEKVNVAAGSVTLGPTDWDSIDVVTKTTVSVRAFRIDRTEVTFAQYESCVRSGLCLPLASREEAEPGMPVTGVSLQEATTYCAYAGGRLPTAAEWIYAASGPEGRRFPWGPHGLVCRRAAFGLVSGPCSTKGIRPDLTGVRPDGATPDGIFDLAGNVAEWAVDEDGTVTVHGGSFRSKTASELKVWSTQPPRPGDDVGFRCAYPAR